MRVVITGTPGVGKTSLSGVLAGRLGIKRVINEKEFAVSEGIGKWDKERDELVVPLERLRAALNREMGKGKGVIAEGHMLCEMRLKADVVVLLRLHPELLEERLGRKGYIPEKVQDNVFCEGIDYCRKHAERNYGKGKVLEVQCRRTVRETADAVLGKMRERGLAA